MKKKSHSRKVSLPDQFQTTLQIWSLVKKVEVLGHRFGPFSTLRIFYVEVATSEGGGEFLHIHSWETTLLGCIRLDSVGKAHLM